MDTVESTVRRWMSWMFLGMGSALSILAYGLAWQKSWATALWPWDDQRMTYIFLASILMAVAVPMIWVGWRRDPAAFEPLALEMSLVSLGIAAYFAWRWFRHDREELGRLIVAAALTAVASLVFARRIGAMRLEDQRELPQYVRIACVIFVAVLIQSGSALILQVNDRFPWELLPQTSTVIGLIFLGSAFLFTWIWFHPRWAYAETALLAFLAYDLVLYVPYVDALLNDDKPRSMYNRDEEINTNGLAIYLIALGISTLVAIYALFIDRRTRVWGQDAPGA